METKEFTHHSVNHLLSTVKHRKSSWLSRVCHHDTLAEIIPKVVVAEESRVNRGGATSRNGPASHCRRCCASRATEVDGRPLQRRRLVCRSTQRPPTTLGMHGCQQLMTVNGYRSCRVVVYNFSDHVNLVHSISRG